MKLNNENQNRRAGVNRIQILQIEDEVEYIINNIDFMLDPEEVSNLVYLKESSMNYFLNFQTKQIK